MTDKYAAEKLRWMTHPGDVVFSGRRRRVDTEGLLATWAALNPDKRALLLCISASEVKAAQKRLRAYPNIEIRKWDEPPPTLREFNPARKERA